MHFVQVSTVHSPDHDGAKPSEPAASPTILVVEDEVLVLMMIADVLDDAGFKVIEAGNADEALNVMTSVPDVAAVVTDVEMPGGSINGFQLAERICAQWKVGVLIASGRAAPKPGELPDGSHFVAKPVYPATLVSLVKTML